MNYIQHLSEFYNRSYHDERLSPHHVSLYMAIFQCWNHALFKNPFAVNRAELMQLSKIGSVNTYLRCLKELDAWTFIAYQPSKNISVGSRIRVITFDNTTGNTADIRLRHFKKQEENITNITLKEVEVFFELKCSGEEEAGRFFNHYQANGWMMGKSPIRDWQAAALKWLSQARSPVAAKKERGAKALPSAKPAAGNLFVNLEKKYDEAL